MPDKFAQEQSTEQLTTETPAEGAAPEIESTDQASTPVPSEEPETLTE